MSGWIALTRDSFKHPVFKREPVSEWEAFARLIRRAAWEDTRHRVGGELKDVPRGSFFCTLRDLQLEFMWKSDKRVRKFLERLENERMIGRKTDAGKTHVTICNYEEYQASGRREDMQRDAAGTQEGRTKETSKQINNKQDKIIGADAPKKPPLFSLFPDCVSEDIAKAYVEHRRAIKKPLTPRAVTLLSKTLHQIRDAGMDPNAALDLAIERGWQGLKFEWVEREFTKGTQNERPRSARERDIDERNSRLSKKLERARQRDIEQGRCEGEGSAFDPSESGMDNGPGGHPVVSLFPGERTGSRGREGFGRLGKSIGPVSAVGSGSGF